MDSLVCHLCGDYLLCSFCQNFFQCLELVKQPSTFERAIAVQWRSQPKNLAGQTLLGGGKMVDFRRIALFFLEKRLSKHKMTIFSENLGGHGPFGPLLATPMS